MKELKLDLSGITKLAAEGEVVEITKHNKPYIRIVAAPTSVAREMRQPKEWRPRPAIVGGTGGKSLEYLLEDREGR